ncbi:MAG TPA: hypothetical protein VIA11_01895, partial [Acidimicrobiia bacterium]|nr:hypothetical protein [Acidimicrobiia bacterium]
MKVGSIRARALMAAVVTVVAVTGLVVVALPAHAAPRAAVATDVKLGASTAHTDVLAFAPTPKNVKAGDHVTFVNNSSAPHTASFGGPL